MKTVCLCWYRTKRFQAPVPMRIFVLLAAITAGWFGKTKTGKRWLPFTEIFEQAENFKKYNG